MNKIRGVEANNNPERARQRARDLERIEEKSRLKKAYSEGEIGQLEYAQRRAHANEKRSKGKFVLPDNPEERERALALHKVLRAVRRTKRKAAPREALRTKPKSSVPRGDDDDDEFGDLFSRMKMGGNKTRRNRGRSTRAKHPR